MPPHRDVLRRGETSEPPRARRLWEDLLTGLSLGVFLVLLACVLVGAWLFESGV
jgi:hypothetical protein